MQFSFNAERVFTVSKGFGLTKAVRQQVREKMAKSGKSEIVNVLYSKAKQSGDPEQALVDKLLPLAQYANNTLSQLFWGIDDLLTGESTSNLPRAPGGGGKRISIPAMGKKLTFQTANWKPLSPSYLKKLKRMVKSGKRLTSLSSKTFWRERPEWADADKQAASLSSMMATQSGGFQDLGYATGKSTLFSGNGASFGFTFDTPTRKLSKVPARTQATKTGKVIRYAVFRGRLLMPTEMGAYKGRLGEVLGKSIFGSFVSGADQPLGISSGKSIGFTRGEDPTVIQLLMVNELHRPFIRRTFSAANKPFIRGLRELALSLK